MTCLLSTVGRTLHPGYELALAVSSEAGLHAHDDAHPRFAICFVQEGSAIVDDGGGRQLLIGAPSLLPLNERCRPSLRHEAGLRMRTLYFHPRAVNGAFRSIEALRGTPHAFTDTAHQDMFLLEPFLALPFALTPIALSAAVEHRLRAAFDQIEHMTRRQPHDAWPCTARSYLIETLFTLRLRLQHPGENETSELNDTPHRLDRALLLVRERYNEPLTLEELARLCGTNRTTLNRHFRRRTGHTVRAYIVHLRMIMAANLLRDTLLPVADIMTRVGYENASHFTRAFRAATGMTPSAYRESTSWMRARSH